MLPTGTDHPSISMTMAFAIVALSAVNLGIVMRRRPRGALVVAGVSLPRLDHSRMDLTWAAVELNMLQRLLDTESLTGGQWLVVIGLSLLMPAIVGIDKAIQLTRQNKTRRPRHGARQVVKNNRMLVPHTVVAAAEGSSVRSLVSWAGFAWSKRTVVVACLCIAIVAVAACGSGGSGGGSRPTVSQPVVTRPTSTAPNVSTTAPSTPAPSTTKPARPSLPERTTPPSTAPRPPTTSTHDAADDHRPNDRAGADQSAHHATGPSQSRQLPPDRPSSSCPLRPRRVLPRPVRPLRRPRPRARWPPGNTGAAGSSPSGSSTGWLWLLVILAAVALAVTALCLAAPPAHARAWRDQLARTLPDVDSRTISWPARPPRLVDSARLDALHRQVDASAAALNRLAASSPRPTTHVLPPTRPNKRWALRSAH